MKSDFAAVTALTRTSELTFRAEVPDSWQQGRGAFGGYVLGLLARAMQAVEPDPRRALRTLAGDVCGPLPTGPAEVVVRVLRRGNNQSNLAAEVRSGGEVTAVASAILSTPRPTPEVRTTAEVPPPADWRATPVVPTAGGPTFTQHYEYRSHAGLPTGTPGAGRIDGFVREAVTLAAVDAPALIGRLDAWWPTLFHAEGRIRPASTVSFVAELLIDPATLPPDEPLRYRARLGALHDGFFVEFRELWRGERLVALNQQTFAIIK